MSGFEDSEYDEAITTAVADISFDDHIMNGMGRHHARNSVQLNTDFTPVRDSPTLGLNNPHSGMTSPAPSSENGGRRSSMRRASLNGAPSDELMSTTAARMNDKAALDEKQRTRSPSYLHVSELPQNSHLLSTTVARVFELNALEEHRQRRDSPQRGFKIAHEDFHVSHSLMRPTESRKAELRAMEEAKRPPSPTFKIAPADFQPPSRLLKMTKQREADRIALDEKKNGVKKVPTVGGKKVSKDYTPGSHLVKPTQSRICAQNQWEKEKEDKRNAKDIWWEERRPAEKAKSRPNTPSKLRSPTKSFLNAKRDKVPISQSIFASPEEAIAYNPPVSLPVPPALPEDSHLLKLTRAASMNMASAETPEEYLPRPPALELATRKSFVKPVESKLYETTTAYEASKFGADLHDDSADAMDPPREKVSSPSERLLRLNTNCAHHVREKAEKTVNAREEGWNPFHDNKARNYPCPANRKRSGLVKHVSQERSDASLSMMSVGYDDGTIQSPSMSYRDDREYDDDDEEEEGEEKDNNIDYEEDPVANRGRAVAVKKTAGKSTSSISNPKSPPAAHQNNSSSVSKKGLNSSSQNNNNNSASKHTSNNQRSPPQKTTAAAAVTTTSARKSTLGAGSATKPKPKAVVAAEVVKKAINSIKEHTKEANNNNNNYSNNSNNNSNHARPSPAAAAAAATAYMAASKRPAMSHTAGNSHGTTTTTVTTTSASSSMSQPVVAPVATTEPVSSAATASSSSSSVGGDLASKIAAAELLLTRNVALPPAAAASAVPPQPTAASTEPVVTVPVDVPADAEQEEEKEEESAANDHAIEQQERETGPSIVSDVPESVVEVEPVVPEEPLLESSTAVPAVVTEGEQEGGGEDDEEEVGENGHSQNPSNGSNPKKKNKKNKKSKK